MLRFIFSIYFIFCYLTSNTQISIYTGTALFNSETWDIRITEDGFAQSYDCQKCEQFFIYSFGFSKIIELREKLYFGGRIGINYHNNLISHRNTFPNSNFTIEDEISFRGFFLNPQVFFGIGLFKRKLLLGVNSSFHKYLSRTIYSSESWLRINNSTWATNFFDQSILFGSEISYKLSDKITLRLTYEDYFKNYKKFYSLLNGSFGYSKSKIMELSISLQLIEKKGR